MYVGRCVCMEGYGGRGYMVSSYLVYLLGDDDGVVAADLLRAELPVVERALVLVTVPVHGAEQPAASALEPCNKQPHNLTSLVSLTLLTLLTAVFSYLYRHDFLQATLRESTRNTGDSKLYSKETFLYFLNTAFKDYNNKNFEVKVFLPKVKVFNLVPLNLEGYRILWVSLHFNYHVCWKHLILLFDPME